MRLGKLNQISALVLFVGFGWSTGACYGDISISVTYQKVNGAASSTFVDASDVLDSKLAVTYDNTQHSNTRNGVYEWTDCRVGNHTASQPKEVAGGTMEVDYFVIGISAGPATCKCVYLSACWVGQSFSAYEEANYFKGP